MPPAQPNPPAHEQPHRRRLLKSGVLLAAVTATATVTACGGSDGDTQTGPLPPATVSSSPTSTPTARQQATTAAAAEVNRYEQTLDRLGTHPGLSLDRLYSVATEPEVLNQIAFFNRFRSAHDRQSGETRVLSIKIARLNLSPSAGGHPVIDITACLDVRGVHAFDSAGRSIVPRTRKPYYLTHLRLVNLSYPDPGSWRVANVTSQEEGRTCAL